MSELNGGIDVGPTPPVWLSELQRVFSRALLESLTCDGRQFLVTPSSQADVAWRLRDTEAVGASSITASAKDRLELYQRQYWMRLFGALQESFPRVALHLGHFEFNRLALHELRAHPPKTIDLADLAPEFGAFLRREFSRPTIPRSGPLPKLLLQALAFDEAELRAFSTPWFPPWQPTPEQLEQLPRQRLTVAPSFSLLREDWPLAERPSGSAVTKENTSFETPRYWVYSRAERSIALHPVEPAFARLLHAVQTQSLYDAVAALERRLNAEGRQALSEKLPQWIQLALEQSWWLE